MIWQSGLQANEFTSDEIFRSVCFQDASVEPHDCPLRRHRINFLSGRRIFHSPQRLGIVLETVLQTLDEQNSTREIDFRPSISCDAQNVSLESCLSIEPKIIWHWQLGMSVRNKVLCYLLTFSCSIFPGCDSILQRSVLPLPPKARTNPWLSSEWTDSTVGENLMIMSTSSSAQVLCGFAKRRPAQQIRPFKDAHEKSHPLFERVIIGVFIFSSVTHLLSKQRQSMDRRHDVNECSFIRAVFLAPTTKTSHWSSCPTSALLHCGGGRPMWKLETLSVNVFLFSAWCLLNVIELKGPNVTNVFCCQQSQNEHSWVSPNTCRSGSYTQMLNHVKRAHALQFRLALWGQVLDLSRNLIFGSFRASLYRTPTQRDLCFSLRCLTRFPTNSTDDLLSTERTANTIQKSCFATTRLCNQRTWCWKDKPCN